MFLKIINGSIKNFLLIMILDDLNLYEELFDEIDFRNTQIRYEVKGFLKICRKSLWCVNCSLYYGCSSFNEKNSKFKANQNKKDFE